MRPANPRLTENAPARERPRNSARTDGTERMRSISAARSAPCERANSSGTGYVRPDSRDVLSTKGGTEPVLMGLAHQMDLEPTPFWSTPPPEAAVD